MRNIGPDNEEIKQPKMENVVRRFVDDLLPNASASCFKTHRFNHCGESYYLLQLVV